jgi:hypothetical protein
METSAMKAMVRIGFAFVISTAALLAVVSPAHAVSCSGSLSGSVSDDVVVPSGATCTIHSASITGGIDVQRGGSLLVQGYLEPTTVGGGISARGCGSALLEGNVTVRGSVRIEGCTGSSASGFQGPGIVISGGLQCSDNAAPCLAWLGKVRRDVAIDHDGGASDISLVDIGGDLSCEGNGAAPTHARGANWVGGRASGQCGATGFVASGTSIVPPGTPAGAGTACAALASLTSFPVPNTQILSAVDTPAGSGLPERCIVNGVVNSHTSPVDGCLLGDTFQVQLPLPSAWNGRFMFQGGGGTEGSVPAATGSAGSASPTIASGYAVASQDGGHENTALAKCGTMNNNEFFLDPVGTIDNSYQSIQVTAVMAKYLINAYYGKPQAHSYWVGCSAGGRQGMVMSQNFPQYFDGIVAGDPVYDLQALQTLSEVYGVQQIYKTYLATPGLPPITILPGPSPEAPQTILYPAFPVADQNLFTTAILQACDALDGTADGVIDNLPACVARFDPAAATYVSGGTTYKLQCTGAKNATCLSAAQIQAVKNINAGPRTSTGQTIQAPAGEVAHDHANSTAQGYTYDGGFMSSAGMPARVIGTATTPPGDYTLGLNQTPYAFISPPNIAYNLLNFDFTTDLGLLAKSTPEVTASTSLDITRFVNAGHKIIWYHGASDPGPPELGTRLYYVEMAAQHGGLDAAQKFSRFYPVQNMGHCGGGPATDTFDMLTPLVQWVENGKAPDGVPASGVNFTGLWQVPAGAPTTRSRLLCPYPQQTRYVGPTSGAGFPAGLASSSNYTCVAPPHSHDGGSDDDGGNDH